MKKRNEQSQHADEMHQAAQSTTSRCGLPLSTCMVCGADLPKGNEEWLGCEACGHWVPRVCRCEECNPRPEDGQPEPSAIKRTRTHRCNVCRRRFRFEPTHEAVVIAHQDGRTIAAFCSHDCASVVWAEFNP